MKHVPSPSSLLVWEVSGLKQLQLLVQLKLQSQTNQPIIWRSTWFLRDSTPSMWYLATKFRWQPGLMVANVFMELSLASNCHHVKEEKGVILWYMATWSYQKMGWREGSFRRPWVDSMIMGSSVIKVDILWASHLIYMMFDSQSFYQLWLRII